MSSAKKLKLDVTYSYNIIPELMNQVIAKMEIKSFIPMYKTCKSMSLMVENTWKNFDYKDMKMAHLYQLTLCDSADHIEIFEMGIVTNYSGIQKGKQIFLPVSVLESYIWRLVRCKHVVIDGDVVTRKYLEKMQGRQNRVEYISAQNCHISTIATTMKKLLLSDAIIYSFKGDVHEIFSGIPLEAWKQSGRGLIAFPYGAEFNDVARCFGDYKVQETFDDSGKRIFDITAHSGEIFSLSVNSGGIVYL